MSLDSERVGELAEAWWVAQAVMDGSSREWAEAAWRDMGGSEPSDERAEVEIIVAQALAPLIAGWLAEARREGVAKGRGDMRAAEHQMFQAGLDAAADVECEDCETAREQGAAEVRARMEALADEWEASGEEANAYVNRAHHDEIHEVMTEARIYPAIASELRAALSTEREEQP